MGTEFFVPQYLTYIKWINTYFFLGVLKTASLQLPLSQYAHMRPYPKPAFLLTPKTIFTTVFLLLAEEQVIQPSCSSD